jgi:hypothetical protein
MARLSPFSNSKVPVMLLAITASSAPTYSGRARIFAASRRLPSLSSSQRPARISALVSSTAVFGFSSSQASVMPKTFSGLCRQISSSVTTGTPMPRNTACWFHGSPTQ